MSLFESGPVETKRPRAIQGAELCKGLNGMNGFRRAMGVLLVVLLFPATSAGGDSILWMNDNLPPAFISDGPDKGEGIVDGVVEIYKEHLPGCEHSHLVANMPRILELMREGRKVCYAGFFKTPERETFISFSIPNLINYMGAVVIKNSRRKAVFSDASVLSLDALLGNRELTAGLTRGRSYGKIIDELIEKNKMVNERILFRSGQDSIQGLLQMLFDERIDYTIGFPWEVPYIAKRIGKRDEFGIILIAEGKDDRWIKNYIGCPKNEWGRKTIEKINRILLHVRPTERYLHHQLKWFPKDIESDIRKAYRDRILAVTE